MRFWLKILVGVVCLILVLGVGAVLFVAQMDANDYRGELSALVEDATGRTLRIGGNLRISLWPNPSIEANDVAFANPDWASQPDMLRIERLEAEILLAPLLQGTVVVERFVAIEPRVFLETDASGRGNWQLGDAQQKPREANGESPSRGMQVVLNQLHVDNAVVDYADAGGGSRRELRVDTLTLGAQHRGGPLELALRARYQDLPVKADGTIGAAQAVLRNESLPIAIRGALGDAAFALEGAIGKPLDGEELNLDFTASAAASKPISDAFGVRLEELGPVDVALKLSGDARRLNVDPFSISAKPRGMEARLDGSLKNLAAQQFTSRSDATARERMQLNVDGRLGDAHLHVEGEAGNLVAARDVRLALRAETPSTRALAELAGVELEDLGPVDASLTLVGAGGRFDVDDIALSARPRDTAASVSGSVKGLVIGRPATPAEPARIDLQGAFGEAHFSVAGDVGKPLQGEDLDVKISIAADSTRALAKLAGVDLEELGPLDGVATVIDRHGRLDLTDIEVKARPREARLTLEGSVTDITGNPNPDVRVSLAANSLRELRQDLPAAGPVEVSAKVEPGAELIEIHDLVAKIGKSDLSGDVTLRTGGERPRASAKLRSKVIDIRELVPSAEQPDSHGSDESSDSKSGSESPTSKRVFSDKALPFDVLKKADGEIELVVDRLFTPRLSLNKVNLSAKLDDGKLTVRPAAEVADGQFGGTVGIDSRVQPAKIEANLDAEKINISKLAEEIRGFQTTQGLESSLKLELSGGGDSVRAIMAGANGDFVLEIGDGQLDNDVLNRVGGDIFMQFFGAIVPRDDEDNVTKVDCGVVRIAVKNGEAIADKTVVLLTDKVLVSGSGVIDLENENLDFGAVLVPRKGIKISAGNLSSIVRVRGTIADPQLGTDLTGVTKTGVKIGAAVFTAGLSLLAEGLIRQVAEDAQPCRTAMERSIDTSPSAIKRLFTVH